MGELRDCGNVGWGRNDLRTSVLSGLPVRRDEACPVCRAMTLFDLPGVLEPAGVSVWPVAQRPAAVQRRGLFVPGSGAHPARMLPDLARHAIHTFSPPGGLVGDVLTGIGTTLVAALREGRDAFGVEYQPRWAALARANAALAAKATGGGQWLVQQCDATRLPTRLPRLLRGRVDLILTSPPYGRTMHGRVEHRFGPLQRFHDSYGPADAASLAHRGLQGLVAGMRDVLTGTRMLLRPGGFLVLTVRPWRRDGVLHDLPGALAQAATEIGLVPVQQCLALLAAIRDGHLLARHSFHQLINARAARAAGIPLLLPQSEDILVLRAPDRAVRPSQAGAW
jgi:modification methylase